MHSSRINGGIPSGATQLRETKGTAQKLFDRGSMIGRRDNDRGIAGCKRGADELPDRLGQVIVINVKLNGVPPGARALLEPSIRYDALE